jgi:hypothetical protein
MKTKLIGIGLAIAWLALGLTPVQAEGIDGYAGAINKAGRQRMLTQRIVKTYCLLGMDIKPRQFNRELRQAVDLFQQQLEELEQFSTSAELTESLHRVDNLWQPFRGIATAQPSERGAAELLQTNDELLAAAHQVVQLLEAQAGDALGRLINVSGRQRMLSQRIAKFYMLRAWGVGGDEAAAGIRRAGEEFEEALIVLQSAPENSAQITQDLREADKQWGIVKRGIEMARDDHYIPVLVAAYTERLLQLMNDITGQYERLRPAS